MTLIDLQGKVLYSGDKEVQKAFLGTNRFYSLGPSIEPGQFAVPGAYDFNIGVSGDLGQGLIYKDSMGAYTSSNRYQLISSFPSVEIRTVDGKEYFRIKYDMSYWLPDNRTGTSLGTPGIALKNRTFLAYSMVGKVKLGDFIKYTAYAPSPMNGNLYVHASGSNAPVLEKGIMHAITPEPTIHYHEVTSLPGKSGITQYIAYQVDEYAFDVPAHFTDIEIIPKEYHNI